MISPEPTVAETLRRARKLLKINDWNSNAFTCETCDMPRGPGMSLGDALWSAGGHYWSPVYHDMSDIWLFVLGDNQTGHEGDTMVNFERSAHEDHIYAAFDAAIQIAETLGV